MSDVPEDRLEEFLDVVHRRLEAGAREYANRSFDKLPGALAYEIEEEPADVVGWAFILWCRIRALRDHVDKRG